MNRRALYLFLLATLSAPAFATTIPVSTTADDATANGNCTLREAIQAAQSNFAVDACPAGSVTLDDLVTLTPAEHELDLGAITVAGSPGPLILRGAPGSPVPPTKVNGSATNPSRLFEILIGANVVFEHVTLQFGDMVGSGGAISAQNANLVVRDCRLAGNTAVSGGALSFAGLSGGNLLVERTSFLSNTATSSSGTAVGGALLILLDAGRTARIVDSFFAENSAVVTQGSGSVFGGAVRVAAFGGSSVEISRSSFSNNTLDVASGGSASGSGVEASLDGAGTRLRVVDSSFSDHEILPPFVGLLTGTLKAAANTGSSLSLDRLRFEHNDGDNPGAHVVLTATGASGLEATNLLIADGPDTGLHALCGNGACVLGHLTIYSHVVLAANLDEGGTAELDLENSILFVSHAVTLAGGAAVDPSTLVGIDPQFTSEAGAGPYVPGPFSPALDSGDATLPSVRALDARHAPRVVGDDTDAGAFERGAIFGDGFESSDVGAWSLAVP